MNRYKPGLSDKKKVFFLGPMGSGKTEISINYALLWSKGQTDKKILLIDLDMVKPMFRLRSVKNKIENNKLQLLLPPEPYSYADFPIITPQVDSNIRHRDNYAVIDVGGEEYGARIIGQYYNSLKNMESEILYVYNAYRPGGDDDKQVIENMELIQKHSRFNLTGIVHNSHLMGESTVDTLESNIKKVQEIASAVNLPVIFHCIREDLFEEALNKINEPLLPIKLYLTPEWMQVTG